MLKLENGNVIAEGYGENYHFWSGNCQDIREAILRQACTSCEEYATDILILLDRNSDTMKTFLEDDSSGIRIDVYFYQNGCGWEVIRDGETVSRVGDVLNHYRAAMTLTKRPHPCYAGESIFTLYKYKGTV